MLPVQTRSTCLQLGDWCQPSPVPRATPLPLVGHGQGAGTCAGWSCRASLAPHQLWRGARSAVGPGCLTPAGHSPGVTPSRASAQTLLLLGWVVGCSWGMVSKDALALGGCSQGMLFEDTLGGCSAKMVCGGCSSKMLFGDALQRCSLGDALPSEEQQERVAAVALAHRGRAPWLTEVLHLASAHKHPRKASLDGEKHLVWSLQGG